jgi:hypothetical protein
MRKSTSLCASICLVALSAVPAAGWIYAPKIQSYRHIGSGPGTELGGDLSDDGRLTVYVSGYTQVLVHDAATATSENAHVSSSEVAGNGSADGVCMSGDGRYVAFISNSTNLIAGDTNGVSDIFLRDRVAGTTERVSLANSGAQLTTESATTSNACVSNDGRYVLFSTGGTLFVRDRTAGTTEQIGPVTYPAMMTPDGGYVLFTSDAALVAGDTNGVEDAYLRDRTLSTTTRVSVKTGGGQLVAGSQAGAITSDGRYVGFIAGDGDEFGPDYGGTTGVVRDRQSGTSQAISYGQQIAMQDDGRMVALSFYFSYWQSSTYDRATDEFWGNYGFYTGDALVNRVGTMTPSGSHLLLIAPGGLYVSAICGDAVKDAFPFEQCDDGKLGAADGCDDISCTVKECWSCVTGTTSVCTAHSDGSACDDYNPCTSTQTCTAGVCSGFIPDPCVVGKGKYGVHPPLRMQGKQLHLLPGAVLEGSVSIEDAGGLILDAGASLESPLNVSVASSAACDIQGDILANGERGDEGESDSGGSISLQCEGITLGEKASIEADGDGGTDDDASGGTIQLDAGSGAIVAAKGSKLSAMGDGDFGGAIDLVAGDECTLATAIRADSKGAKLEGEILGGYGGSLQVTCGGDITLGKGTQIVVGREKSVDAGTMAISSGGALDIGAGVKIRNHGFGGTIDLSGAPLHIAEKSKIEGTALGDEGVALRAESAGSCEVGGKIALRAKALKFPGDPEQLPGIGGSVELDCDSSVEMTGSIDVSGKGGDKLGNLSDAGSVTILSGGPATVSGKILATAKGTGGAINVEGCDVTVADGGKLVAKGAVGGSNSLTAHGILTVHGSVDATSTEAIPGTNTLLYRNGVVIGDPDTIEPSTAPFPSPGLSPCP